MGVPKEWQIHYQAHLFPNIWGFRVALLILKQQEQG